MLKSVTAILVLLLLRSGIEAAQAPVATVLLDRDQIWLVKTAQGITTRISFQEPVREIICGDLYDPGSGKGSFVVQKGDNDVFLKPIAPKGFSNLFVKTGERGEHIFNFDLLVVPLSQAYRVVNVVGANTANVQANTADSKNPEAAEGNMPARDSDEVIRSAKQQAGRIIAEAEQQAADIQKQSYQRAEREVESRFVRSLMLGLREIKINPRVTSKRVIVNIDRRVLTFDDRSYLRYTLQNTGDAEFIFNSISLEGGSGGSQQIQTQVVQSKDDNRLASGETLAGILIFDPKLLESREPLMLYVRGSDNNELARAVIAQ